MKSPMIPNTQYYNKWDKKYYDAIVKEDTKIVIMIERSRKIMLIVMINFSNKSSKVLF